MENETEKKITIYSADEHNSSHNSIKYLKSRN